MTEKHFLLKDHSGRGLSVTLSASDIHEQWELDFKNDPADAWEDSLGDWLESANVGDTFSHDEANVTFTRTN